jgi:hypothetical protein
MFPTVILVPILKVNPQAKQRGKYCVVMDVPFKYVVPFRGHKKEQRKARPGRDADHSPPSSGRG